MSFLISKFAKRLPLVINNQIKLTTNLRNYKKSSIINNLNAYSKKSSNSNNTVITNSTTNTPTITINNKQYEISTNFYDKHIEINMKKQIDHANNNMKEKYYMKRLPYIWLRDNCKCKHCYDKLNDELNINLSNISLNVKPKQFVYDSDTDLTIVWSDDHVSHYNLETVGEYAFENELKEELRSEILWNNQLLAENGIPTFDYENYMNDDYEFKNALASLVKYGVMIVNNIPLNIENSRKAIERICFVQKTIYGEICTLKANGEYVDSAYSTVGLKAHHDCTYFKNAPGVEIFQLLKHDGAGGNTLLVDGFYCANKLKELYPEDFEALTRLSVKGIYRQKNEYNMQFTDPVIKLNPLNNSLMQIRYNVYNRTIVNHLSYEDTLLYYKSIKRFAKIIEDSNNEHWIRLKYGQLLFINNYRVLHGRSQFNGNRELLTAYLPHDDWLSKARVLKLL